jgi:hypothetical protein
MYFVGRAFPVFGFAEEGKNVLRSPAAIAEL